MKILTLVVFAVAYLPLQAQQITVTGKVLSGKDQTPLAGVSIQVSSAKGTISRNDGSFSLPAAVGVNLHLSMEGYLPKSIKVTQADLGVIMLDPTQKSLDSVVVVGYGTQKKVNLTGAITTVNMEDKEGQPVTNVSNALHGTPGLFVNLSNSQPGVDRSDIRIRGIGTLNTNDPLVLVDGVEYSMDELNPADIATITVLKDASAAIYGSRAGNGVILVTTKKGHGAAKVNYNYYYGKQKTTYMPDAIWDPIAYMKLKNQAELNEGKTAVDYSDADIAEYQNGMKTDPYTYPASNWFDIALDNGTIQKHDVSVAASTDKYQYRFSLGYLDRNGVMIGPNNHEKKYSIGLNTSVNVTKRLKVGLNLDGYYRNYTQPFYNSFWQYLTRTLPILTDTLKNGSYGNSWLRTPGRNNWENPRMIAYTGYGKKTVQRFLASTFLDYKLPFDITYHAQFGVDKYDGLLDEFTPQVQTFNPKTLAPTNWNSPATAPRAQETDYNDLKIHFYNTLNWQHTFAESHHGAVMLGASYDNFGTTKFVGAMTGYLDGTLTALDAGTVRYNTSGNSTTDVLESYFGRLNYDYDGKYLLEATFRYDGSSRFAEDRRWGFFPSVSAGWRIDRENFFKNNELFQLLKLRASVGQMGNQAVPPYSYTNAIVLGQNYAFGGVLQSGAAATTYSDPGITWETTTTYNAGIDAELLKRLNITFDVDKKRTTHILRTVNIPSQVGGLKGPQENIGTMDNTGIELSVRYNGHAGELGYSVFGNLSYNKNKVVEIDGQILYNYDNSGISSITKAGYPIDAFYLLHAVGIFQSDAEVAASPHQSAATRAGYIKFEDVNHDNIINADDRKIINSSSIVPTYNYGFGLNLDYKGFSLSGVFQGVAGIKVYPTANLAYPFNNGANATREWLTDAWTPTHTNARLPIVTESTGNGDNFQASDFWLRSGAYLRLKDIQLSYALPKKWLNLAKISRISVFVNAENWVTFSKYKDYDPETLMNSANLYTYPMLKTISGGVNVNF